MTKFSRKFSMPNKQTFQMKPVQEFLDRWCSGVIVDPFCGESGLATYGNDLKHCNGLDARVYLADLIRTGVVADTVILDPPYSPRQITESYKSVGIRASANDTQNSVLYAECRSLMRGLLRGGGVALQFGWNSCGWGDGFDLQEVLIVNHGGAHNDTLCTAWKKLEALF